MSESTTIDVPAHGDRSGEHLPAEHERAIDALIAGRDAVVVMPCGSGRSQIYEAIAPLLDGPTVVVSPAPAVMRDQERRLRSHGIPVVRVDGASHTDPGRADAGAETLGRIRRGGALVVLTTPERLGSIRDELRAARTRLLCVEDAHCISERSHDFRPAYLRLRGAAPSIGAEVTLALTATATARVRDEIAARLDLRGPVQIIAPPARENVRLSVEVVTAHAKLAAVGRWLRRATRPALLYAATSRAVDELFAALSRAGTSTVRCHERLPFAERIAAQRAFLLPGSRLVMITTSGFGIGGDSPGLERQDLHAILHVQSPSSPEQYVLDIGRAGRDGRPAWCSLLFDAADLAIQHHLFARHRPDAGELRRVAFAFAEAMRDRRLVEPAQLATAAGVLAIRARSLCAELEAAGVVERDAQRRYVASTDVEMLLAQADELARQLTTLQHGDQQRLAAVAAYAQTEDCRSRFLSRWLGVTTPPPCGHCDRCAAVLEPARPGPRAREL